MEEYIDIRKEKKILYKYLDNVKMSDTAKKLANQYSEKVDLVYFTYRNKQILVDNIECYIFATYTQFPYMCIVVREKAKKNKKLLLTDKQCVEIMDLLECEFDDVLNIIEYHCSKVIRLYNA